MMRSLDADMDTLRSMVREVAEVVGMKRLVYESGVGRRTVERWLSGESLPRTPHRRAVMEAIGCVVCRMQNRPWVACKPLLRQLAHRG